MTTRPYLPSNGTEGADFEARACDLCERDREWRRRGLYPCEVHNDLLIGVERPEVVTDADDPRDVAPPRTARCSAFIPEGTPIPAAEDPAQWRLFMRGRKA